MLNNKNRIAIFSIAVAVPLICTIYCVLASISDSAVKDNDYKAICGLSNNQLPKSLKIIKKKVNYSKFSSRNSYLAYELTMSKSDLETFIRLSNAKMNHVNHVDFNRLRHSVAFKLLEMSYTDSGVIGDKLRDFNNWYFIADKAYFYVSESGSSMKLLISIDPYAIGVMKRRFYTDQFAM